MSAIIVNQLIQRDLAKLKNEILAYKNESTIWQTEGEINNSAGNLALHLVGNLNTYVGKELGGIDYIRNRDLEFSNKDIPRAELVKMIEDTASRVDKALSGFDMGKWEEDFPILVFENKTSTAYMLIHLAAHLDYHLGQVNYHRRLLDK